MTRYGKQPLTVVFGPNYRLTVQDMRHYEKALERLVQRENGGSDE